MTVTLSLAICAALAVLAVFAGWRGALPPNLVKGPRMIPWRAVMLFSSTGVVLMLAYLVNMVRPG